MTAGRFHDRRFRTLPDRAHTAITGYSLGGLISAYAGIAYDSTFGLVGACSPTYGWGPGPGGIYGVVGPRYRWELPVRYYQDTGYPRDNGIDDMETRLLDRGYTEGIDLMSITARDATHSFDAWEHRFPGMLRFLFPPGPD